VDSCVWLGSIPGYVLSGTAKVLVDLVMDDVEGGEGGPKHLDRPVFLPHSLDSYDGSHVTSPGRPGIPAFVPSWSQADEKKFLDGLIKDLNENLLAGLDPNPNLSRSKMDRKCIWRFEAAASKELFSSADQMLKACPRPPQCWA